MMEQNILGVTLKGLGSKGSLYYVSQNGVADIIADGKIEDDFICEVEDSFKKSELVTSIYDPRIAKLIKTQKPEALGKNWESLDQKSALNTKTYMLSGKEDSTSNCVSLDFDRQKVTVSLETPTIAQHIDVRFSPQNTKIFPETVEETFLESC
jgi:hypothetical protein